MAPPNTPPGPGVDASGQAVVDPTENVKALSEAANKRQDDLRTQTEWWLLREMDLRATHASELASKEAARIDANRAQDQDSARRSTETALTAVQALAVQAPITADAVRVAAAASLNPVLERLTNIERVQYEQAGSKQQSVETSVDRRAGTSQVWIVVGVVVAAVTGVLGFLVALGALIYLIAHG